MSVFSSPSFDQHELVVFSQDPSSGLRAIIAVHNTNLGPGLGGCRMFDYKNEQAAIEDVLRLSRGMTYKSALADLPLGGGKAVIIGDPHTQKSTALLEAMGRFIQAQAGRYVTAEDSGTNVSDIAVMGSQTEFISGVNDTQNFGGDPSPLTAYGIFCGIKAAHEFKHGSSDLNGLKVAVQGAGAVGLYLIKLLVEAGAVVSAADINQSSLEKATQLGAQIVDPKTILQLDVDVFSPCAMGAVINDESIHQLRATIIAGGANNQLAENRHGDVLREKGILYAPDFVINAGGIIDIHHQRAGTMHLSKAHIAKIGDTLSELFKQSAHSEQSTVTVAEQLAEAKFMNKTISHAA